MTYINRTETFMEDPALLGSPELTAFRAYCVIPKPDSMEIEDSDLLGAAIYEGRLARQTLDDSESNLEFEENFALEDAVQAGEDARKKAILRLLPMVVSISANFAYDKDHRYSQERRAEMVCIGNLALVKCLDGYIHLPGRHIAAFASRSVRNAMIKEIMDTIRSNTGRSTRMQQELLAVDAAYREAQKEGVEITFLEMAEKLGHSTQRLEHILKLTSVYEHSLDDPIITQMFHGNTPNDILKDETSWASTIAVEDSVLLDQVWQTAQELHRRQVISEEEWEVFTSRYAEGLSQREVGDRLEAEKTQSGIYAIEQRTLKKIRKEIEMPGYHEKGGEIELRIVESAVDLLGVLRVPIDKDTDIVGLARNLLDNIRLTAWQREVMQALMGTNGKHWRPAELAHSRQRSHRAIYDAREKAMRNILTAWRDMTEEQKQTAIHTAPETPITAKSAGPRPNVISDVAPATAAETAKIVATMSASRILERAIDLKPTGKFTKADITRLAAEGVFVNLPTIERRFRSWTEFQLLHQQAQQQMRR